MRVHSCLHACSNRKPILAGPSPASGCCRAALSYVEKKEIIIFCCFALAPDWQWPQPGNFCSADWGGCIRCKGVFSPNEFDYCMSGMIRAEQRETMCLRTICASSARFNSVDNVWFLSGNSPQEAKETFVPRRHGGDCLHIRGNKRLPVFFHLN